MQETFGQRLQRLRKNASLTQEDVAAKLNITGQAVSKWENDVSAPDISVLIELSDILGVSLDELLGKDTPTTVLVPESQRKGVDQMFLRVNVLSKKGDKVKINLPLAIGKAFLENGALPQINGKDVLQGIDFQQVFSLIEQGVVGKLVEMESADGDIVEIWVE